MASSNSLTQAGGALSAHHELQLMREQLDQQSQQTQAAMAQLQLVREQLAAEQVIIIHVKIYDCVMSRFLQSGINWFL